MWSDRHAKSKVKIYNSLTMVQHQHIFWFDGISDCLDSVLQWHCLWEGVAEEVELLPFEEDVLENDPESRRLMIERERESNKRWDRSKGGIIPPLRFCCPVLCILSASLLFLSSCLLLFSSLLPRYRIQRVHSISLLEQTSPQRLKAETLRNV